MRSGAGADRAALLGRHGPRAAGRAFGAQALLKRLVLLPLLLLGLLLRGLPLDLRRLLLLRLLLSREREACGAGERYHDELAHGSLLTAHGASRVPGTRFAP